jgi:hypothetical protein
MTVADEIEAYIAMQAEPKGAEMRALHDRIRRIAPASRLWFLDGRDSAGKVVSNPNIGYGSRTITYANGTSREFYQVGLSANTAGISLYIMGLEDKTLLQREFGGRVGKASMSGYCVKFKTLEDVDVGTLEEIIRLGFAS